MKKKVIISIIAFSLLIGGTVLTNAKPKSNLAKMWGNVLSKDYEKKESKKNNEYRISLYGKISEKTEEQLEYVMTSIKENVFLKACAGSGKTEVIGLKAAYEMKKWNSYNQGIAVLTFTNDATDVIIDRVKQFTGRNAVYPHYIGTLSSFIHSYIVQPFAYTLTGFEGKDEDFSFNIIDRTVPVYSNSWLNTYKCRVSYLEANNRWSSIFAHQIGYDIEKKDFYFYIGKNKME